MRFLAIPSLLVLSCCHSGRSGDGLEPSDLQAGDGDSPTTPVPPVSTPFFPKLGAIDLVSSSRRIDVEGDVAFLAQEFFGFVAVDVSDSARPSVLSEVAIPSVTGVYDLDAEGGFLYVAANELGLFGYDVRNPSRPVELFQVPSFKFGSAVLGVFVRDGRLYVASGGGGISVWDVSDPTAFDDELACVNGQVSNCQDGDCEGASLLGCYQDFPIPDYFHDAIVRGGTLLAPTAQGGVVALDVSDPAAIAQLGSAPAAPGQVLDLDRAGDVAFGASVGHGLVAVDVSQLPPSGSLPILGGLTTGGFRGAEGIAVASKRGGATFAYVATFRGLDVIDVSQPQAPVLVEHLEGQQQVRDAVVRGGKLYLARGSRGLAIYGSGL